MCKWGTTVDLPVTIPADLSHTEEGRVAAKAIDACIAPIVKALNDAGILTRSSCCGHEKRPGSIALADGREILLSEHQEGYRRGWNDGIAAGRIDGFALGVATVILSVLAGVLMLLWVTP